MLDRIININNSDVDNAIPFSNLLESPAGLKPVDIHQGDLAVIIYTSGTTGNPKGCMATQDYFLNLGEIQGKLFQLTDEDRVFTAQPFYYMDPQWNTIMVMIHNATLIFAERFSTSQFWDQIRHYKTTCFYCIGSMTSFLYNMPPSDLDKHRFSRRRSI